jgi:glycerol-3-phosphate acyltransferase PlsY
VIWFVVALIVIVSYLLGTIPSGLIISKSQGIDIREHGSKNIGATNVWRTMGKKWGALAFLCDTFKGWLAVYIGVKLAAALGVTIPLPHEHFEIKHLPPDYAGIAAALGCILGHNFPVWLRFKGGKGVATSLGVIIGMMPLVSLVIFAIWGIVLKLSRYVSLASLVAALALPITVIALMFFGPSQGWASVHGWGNFYFGVAAAIMVFKRHTANIKRLLNGTELRFGTPKPQATTNSATEESSTSEPPQS